MAMIWLVYAVLAIVGVVVAMGLAGLLLRADHLTARSAVVPRPPAEVYAVIRDFPALPSWRPELRSVELLPDQDGRPCYREHGAQGPITFVLELDQPPGEGAGRLVARIADEQLPFGGHWVIDLAPDSAGCRVTVTEDGVVKNPVFRFLSRTLFSLAATQEQWLRALGRHFGVELAATTAEPAVWSRE